MIYPIFSKRILLFLLGSLCWLGSIAPLQAGTPTAAMETVVSKALLVLRDPAFQQPGQKTERREKLRAAIYTAFDFERMSRGAVGLRWRVFTEGQKQRFMQLFERLLENTYMNSVERYKNEEVRFVREVLLSSSAARVDSVVESKGAEFKLSYQLHRQDSHWKISDVTIEGVSVVANYRAQFRQLLRRGSSEEIEAMLVTLARSVQKSDQ